MKKLVLILALALGGCGTTGGVISSDQISQTAKQIQGYTRTVCSFVPTIATVASIISARAGNVLTIGNDICAAITTAPLADGGPRAARVSGVALKGKFVR